jgi:GT2 family glycosyltransferase
MVKALTAQTLDPSRFEVLFVDDCSGDDTPVVLASLAELAPFPMRPLQTPTNGGPAAARNLGWRGAEAQLVAFIDDDCLPEPGWLEAGLLALQEDTTIGVLQGCTKAPEGVDVHGLGDWYLWRVIPTATPFFEGCNIFYRRPALEQAGGFDEDIRWWGEDTSLGWSVVEAGWNQTFAPEAVAVHEVERRGWWWHVKNGYLERNVVRLAAEHPGYRQQAFWRPWAFRREDAAFILAVTAAMAALRWRPAGLLALPYLWWRRPSIRRPNFFRLCFQTVVVDAARAGGHLSGAIKYRVVVI